MTDEIERCAHGAPMSEPCPICADTFTDQTGTLLAAHTAIIGAVTRGTDTGHTWATLPPAYGFDTHAISQWQDACAASVQRSRDRRAERARGQHGALWWGTFTFLVCAGWIAVVYAIAALIEHR